LGCITVNTLLPRCGGIFHEAFFLCPFSGARKKKILHFRTCPVRLGSGWFLIAGHLKTIPLVCGLENSKARQETIRRPVSGRVFLKE
jgi:hypothetical protein